MSSTEVTRTTGWTAGTGADLINGEGGVDYADYRTRTNNVNVSLGDGVANEGETGENDHIVDTEGIFGGSGNDTLSGSTADEDFWPNAGNDSVSAGGGNNVLNWSDGVDSMAGGSGTDMASFLFTASVSVSLDGVANDGHAGEGDNIAADVENLEGGPESDVLVGSDAANAFDPSSGDDRWRGWAGRHAQRLGRRRLLRRRPRKRHGKRPVGCGQLDDRRRGRRHPRVRRVGLRRTGG